jgi:4-hydroxy-tetrahydrodipicolinate reductase
MNAEKPVPLAVIGAAGRMGQRIIACAQDEPRLRVVAAVDAPQCPRVGEDAGSMAGCAPLGVRVTADLAVCAAARVVIDFALADGCAARVASYAQQGCAIVLGSTGVDAAGLRAVQDAARLVPVVHAANFSLGVNVLCHLVAAAARALGAEYDVEVVEMHHRRKQDAPSGTAVRLVEVLEAARGLTPAARRHGRVGAVGARTRAEIGVHALRGGDVVGDHTVMFAGEGERVELTHKASTRDTFARGALRAALFLAGAKPGLYTMADILGLTTEQTA